MEQITNYRAKNSLVVHKFKNKQKKEQYKIEIHMIKLKIEKDRARLRFLQSELKNINKRKIHPNSRRALDEYNRASSTIKS